MCTPEQRRERRTPEKEERKGTPKRKERRGRRAMRSVRREKNTSIEKRMGPSRPWAHHHHVHDGRGGCRRRRLHKLSLNEFVVLNATDAWDVAAIEEDLHHAFWVFDADADGTTSTGKLVRVLGDDIYRRIWVDYTEAVETV
jgi:hypothetical protein